MLLSRSPGHPRLGVPPIRWLRSAALGVVMALVSSLVVLVGGAPAASAATPIYEIEGAWVNPPPTIDRGQPGGGRVADQRQRRG